MSRSPGTAAAAGPFPRWGGAAAWVAGGIGTLALLAWGGAWLSAPGRFTVESVRLTSLPERVTPEAVRAAVLPHVDEGLLRVDVREVQAELRALPWVRNAAVRRVWPDRLEIALEEHQAVASWKARALVDEEGRLFTPPAEEWPEGLPRLSGPEGSTGKVLARFASMRHQLLSLGLEVVELEVDARQAWSLQLDNGIELLLGAESQSVRLGRFVQLYETLIGPRVESVQRVDLRYTNGVALGWRDATDGDA